MNNSKIISANASEKISMNDNVLLDVKNLTHVFPLSKKIAVKAVDDLSFRIYKGEIFGLVGESGSGKSTAARCVMNIYQPYAGQIYYKGIDTCDRSQFRKNKKSYHRSLSVCNFSRKARIDS